MPKTAVTATTCSSSRCLARCDTLGRFVWRRADWDLPVVVFIAAEASLGIARPSPALRLPRRPLKCCFADFQCDGEAPVRRLRQCHGARCAAGMENHLDNFTHWRSDDLFGTTNTRRVRPAVLLIELDGRSEE